MTTTVEILYFDGCPNYEGTQVSVERVARRVYRVDDGVAGDPPAEGIRAALAREPESLPPS